MKYEYKTRMIQVWTWAAWYAIATAFVVASWCWLGSSTGYGQDTGPYVYKTGSKSTGRQVFAGINGQINLPVGNLPAFPIEGDIQNVSGVGLEVYKGGVDAHRNWGGVSGGLRSDGADDRVDGHRDGRVQSVSMDNVGEHVNAQRGRG